LQKFGKLSLAKVLEPAIRLAEEGFPVSPVASYQWSNGLQQLRNGPYGDEMLLNGRPPKVLHSGKKLEKKENP
jgi:gamma-glutamyltranspeptidase/glutathione hydrolase